MVVESGIRHTEANFLPLMKEKDACPKLTFKENQVLKLLGKGLVNKEIAERLPTKKGNIPSKNTIRAHLHNIFKSLDTNNRFSAVLIGIKRGILNLDELTKGLGRKPLSKLTGREIEVLKTMTDNEGENSSKERAAKILNVSPRTVQEHTLSISRKLNLNKMQSALLYLRYKDAPEEIPDQKLIFSKPEKEDDHGELTTRGIELLGLIGKGFTHEEIVEVLSPRNGHKANERTIQTHMRIIFKRLGAVNRLNALIIASNDASLNLNELMEGMDANFLHELTPVQTEILNAMIDNNGKNSSFKEIANNFTFQGKKLSISAVRRSLLPACRELNLGTNTMRLALFYLAAKRSQSKDKEIFNRLISS